MTIPTDLNDLGRALQNKHNHHGYVGGTDIFDQAGRDIFILLLEDGLLPHHKVLDIGCGVFRLGYWLIRFLDAGCYFGSETRPGTVEVGRTDVIGEELFNAKQPTIEIDSSFNLAIFGQKFDYVIARSIWSHASRGQVAALLDSFAKCSKPTAVLFATYLPAASELDVYTGDKWHGGLIRHYFHWLQFAAEKRGLQISEIVPRSELAMFVQIRSRQHWLRVSHAQR